MGQYFHIANNTTKEYLNDHRFHDFGFVGGHGIKWGEITFSRFTSLHLLSILIASDTSFGSRQNPSFTGFWSGDSIGMYGDSSAETKWEEICENYTDITPELIRELLTLEDWREAIEGTATDTERTRRKR